MANFKPLKQRFLNVLDINLRHFGITGRFLDYGCGSGDVSEFLVQQPYTEDGIAYDPALDSEDLNLRHSALGDHALQFTNSIEDLGEGIDFAVLFDVIEHIPDPEKTLQELHGLVDANGWLAITVPYNSHEWGDDDEFYGHLRRLSKHGVISLLERNGWEVFRVLDPTFPSFWAIRRVYLTLSKFSLRFANPQPRHDESEVERSLASSRQSAWNTDSLIARLLSRSNAAWSLVRRLDIYFESIFWGFELFVLCRRREDTTECQVCRQGNLSYYRTFGPYSLQQCSHCRSEQLLSAKSEDLYNSGYYSEDGTRFYGFMEKMVFWFRSQRVRSLQRLPTPEQSMLDIGCGRGVLPKLFKRSGWRALGTQVSKVAADAAREGGADVILAEIHEIPSEEPFGLVTLFHVIEHLPDLQRSIDHIIDLVRPGGYLVLEYPNARSWLKRLTGVRWFAYDPPFHLSQINPVVLSDVLGLRNFRLVKETYFSLEYSFFVFAQTAANLLLPFQRDAFYRMLRKEKLAVHEYIGAAITLPLFALALIPYAIYQPVASLMRRGCIVRQIYRKISL